tara:strand:- start:231 stop:548 length:318 start_codon:yes stop_codon:yes gene_type:complete
MKLKLLAEAAIEFYGTPDLRSRVQPDTEKTKAARYACWWVACESLKPRYKKSDVGRFWAMDRTAVFYGCKLVNTRIAAIPAEKRQLKAFVRFVKQYIKKHGRGVK